jgi:hypothetical protein
MLTTSYRQLFIALTIVSAASALGQDSSRFALFAYPTNAILVRATSKLTLQSKLDQYNVIRLEAANYRQNGLSSITLKSGQEIYGLPGTVVPSIIVKPGTTNAVLSTVSVVWEQGVHFPPSNLITRQNRFQRLQGPIWIDGACLEDNLFLDSSVTQFYFDTRSSGYMKNNRFIRSMAHSTSPQWVMRGDVSRKSSNNVFLWFNFLFPHGDGVYLENHKDVTLIGFDAETWNEAGQTTQALFRTGPMGALRIFLGTGGNNGATPTGIFDIAADEFQLFDEFISGASNPHIVLRPGNLRTFFIDTAQRTLSNLTTGNFRFKAFERPNIAPTLNGTSYLSALPESAQSTLRSMIVNPLRTGQLWEGPLFVPIPDPAGSNWNQDLASRPDSTTYIQNLIDTQGIASLPAGTYYISSSLKMGAGEGLIGSGMSSTVIIAKNSDIDMIVNRGGAGLNLADLTLQGGKNGIHHQSPDLTTVLQFSLMLLSHVTFRDMKNAGIQIQDIFGWDNNFVDYLNFVNCPSGIQQMPSSSFVSGGPETQTMCYMDKTVFYGCQFMGCGIGVNLPAKRANNLNAWINCLFQNSTNTAMNLENCKGHLLANCHFINNAGNPTIQNNLNTDFVSCLFRADALGKTMLGTQTCAEGCTFERGTSNSAFLLAASGINSFYNCNVKMPAGTILHGMLFNSFFSSNPMYNQQGMIIYNQIPYAFLMGIPIPSPQLLFGNKWQ